MRWCSLQQVSAHAHAMLFEACPHLITTSFAFTSCVRTLPVRVRWQGNAGTGALLRFFCIATICLAPQGSKQRIGLWSVPSEVC